MNNGKHKAAAYNLQPATCNLQLLLPCLLFFLLMASEADAANTALAFCQGLRTTYPTQYLRPLVDCFTDSTQGYIPVAAIAFMTATQGYYFPAAFSAMALAIAFFGIRALTLDSKRFRGDGFTLLLKMAAVVYFIADSIPIYQQLLAVMVNLNQIIVKAVVDSAPAGAFCVSSGAAPDPVTGQLTYNIWQMWDCLLNNVVGASGPALGTAGIISFIFIMFVTLGSGIAIFVAIVFLILGILFSIARFVQLYIMAVLGLSFVFALWYLFVPFLLFKGSFKYFQKWLNICLGYLLTPMIMFGFMAMMLLAMDSIVISGQFSIMHEIFGAGYTQSSPTQIQCPKNNDPDQPLCVNKMEGIFWLGIDPNGNTKIPTKTRLISHGDSNSMPDIQVKGSVYDTTPHNSSIDVGVHKTAINVQAMATAQGQGKNIIDYVIDIIISSLVACLMAYIMFSLLPSISDLASALVAQGTNAAKQVANAEVFGQALITHAVELGKEAAMAIASGGGSAAANGMKMMQQAQKMATKR